LPNAAFELRHGEHYMLCVADVARALECRGWPAGVAGEWAFELVGAAVPDDDGPWTLQVRDGAARCTRGGRPAVQVTGRALASLYAGFRSPWALAQTGGLTGDAAVFPQLAALFTGGAPIIPDMF
jgi:predicted acetyltransferase